MNRLRFFNLVGTVIAVGAGLITLAGYFIRLDVLLALRLTLVSLASLLAAWAVMAGALNLLIVHTRKFTGQGRGSVYSIFVLLGFIGVIFANMVGPLLGGGRGAASAVNTWLLTYLISAGSAALSALVAFFLLFAGFRLLRGGRGAPTAVSVAFVISAVLALLALAPWPSLLPNPSLAGTTLRDVLRTLTQVPALAGARGLLLGVALGSVATGLRVLLGLDRPYGD